jgi:glucose-6-phosphate 1-dehydrogenase
MAASTEPIWNSTHIAEVDIVWDESLALEGRAGYYEGVGALKDMLQNHLLQLLCLVATNADSRLRDSLHGQCRLGCT